MQHDWIRLLEELDGYLDNSSVVETGFRDLSKTFNWIPHDVLMVKLQTYGFDDYLVHYIYLYLDKREQCMRTNNGRNS